MKLFFETWTISYYTIVNDAGCYGSFFWKECGALFSWRDVKITIDKKLLPRTGGFCLYHRCWGHFVYILVYILCYCKLRNIFGVYIELNVVTVLWRTVLHVFWWYKLMSSPNGFYKNKKLLRFTFLLNFCFWGDCLIRNFSFWFTTFLHRSHEFVLVSLDDMYTVVCFVFCLFVRISFWCRWYLI